ncbi:MFS transporter [Novosphingobium profundi]|uniref:MFS transporter n=1 Tax=Novosphingobium profundi TaxID=1774954 RepID=UPI001BDAD8B8|nr:MFS transporter [Novosphingobium profundi]MBT0667311.1 MFS transporter [Novosphingobium profundi]
MHTSSGIRATMLAACLAFGVVQVDVSVVNVGLPQIGADFHADVDELQWVINGYALSFSAILLIAGSWADLWGAKRVFNTGFALFVATSAGCAVAPGLPALIAMRILQGFGAALMVPCALALVRLGYEDPEARRRALAVFGACGGLGMGAGPVIGGMMISLWGWPSVFLLNVPIGLIAIGLILRWGPATPATPKRLRLSGQLWIAMSIAAACAAMTQASAQGWGTQSAFMGIVAVFASGAFIWIERRSSAPLLPSRLIKNPQLLSMLIAGLSVNLTFFGMVFVLSLYFQNVLGYDASHAGFAFVPLTAILAISSMASSHIGRWLDGKWIILMGFSIEIVGFLAMARIDGATSPIAVDVMLLLIGTGTAMATPSIMNTMMSSVCTADAGIASGIMSSSRQVGGVVGVALFASLVGDGGSTMFLSGMSQAALICASVLVICAGLALLARATATPSPL